MMTAATVPAVRYPCVGFLQMIIPQRPAIRNSARHVRMSDSARLEKVLQGSLQISSSLIRNGGKASRYVLFPSQPENTFFFDFRLDLNFTLRFMIHHWKHSSGDLTEPEGYRPMAQANEPLGTLL